MPWHAKLIPDLPIVETCYSGVLTSPELADAIHETLALVRSSGRTLLLGDCTALEGGHSLLDLYSHADALGPGGTGYVLKEAVLLPAVPASAEMVKFWETLCCNRGMTVRIFQDRQTAIDWLLSGSDA